MGSDASLIRSVERALGILDCFTPKTPELTLTDISNAIGLAPSTTTRLLATLVKNNYLARNRDTNKYYLGPRIIQLGAIGFAHVDYRKIALPFMTELRNYFNESISLYVLDGNCRICMERVESTQALRRVINVGDRLPLIRGASGRLILAYMDKNKAMELIKNDDLVTEEGLDRIKEEGYTISRGEREEGVTSIATPIFNINGEMIAALTISGPSARFPEESMAEKIEKMKEYAKKISKELGYYDKGR